MQNKVTLNVQRTQEGKTFTTIQKICSILDNDTHSIHLVFTMNTLLSNQQFSNRLKVLEERYGEGTICILSSR